eukprot:SAG22_NODE_131_length_18561_cov_10.941387_4_plen_95_part_00
MDTLGAKATMGAYQTSDLHANYEWPCCLARLAESFVLQGKTKQELAVTSVIAEQCRAKAQIADDKLMEKQRTFEVPTAFPAQCEPLPLSVTSFG